MLITKRKKDAGLYPEYAAFQIPSLFDEFWSEGGLASSQRWTPAMDVSETESEYKVRLETPGMAKEDIKVEIENGVLTVSGEKTVKEEHKTERLFRTERRYGSFTRSLRFTDVDAGKVAAAYKDGVLEITVAKAEQAKPKKIDIG